LMRHFDHDSHGQKCKKWLLAAAAVQNLFCPIWDSILNKKVSQ